MKADFYYNKRKYTCGISKTDSSQELRIRNERGEVLAIEQGKRIGLQGKRRESSREVDVSQPHFYNIIKAALSALEIADKNRVIAEKDCILKVKDEQINILNQQLNIFKNEGILSSKQEQELRQLQDAMKKQEAVIKAQNEQIAKLEDELTQLPQTLPLEKIENKVRAKLGDKVWSCLHPCSQRELCDAYRNYLLIKSEEFTAQFADYSGAGHPLGIIAEREIITPFFKELYQFLSAKNNQVNVSAGATFEVGGVILRLRGKYTLGDLPALLSVEWETFIDNVLEQQDIVSSERLYHTVFFGNQVSQKERRLIREFFQQWQHPLSKWLARGQIAASTIDQIRKLRNIADHAEPMYRWQFKVFWSLLVGGKTSRGLLQEIYESSAIDNCSYQLNKVNRGMVVLNSPP